MHRALWGFKASVALRRSASILQRRWLLCMPQSRREISDMFVPCIYTLGSCGDCASLAGPQLLQPIHSDSTHSLLASMPSDTDRPEEIIRPDPSGGTHTVSSAQGSAPAAEASRTPLPSDADWSEWPDPPQSSTCNDAKAKQSSKRTRSSAHKAKRPNCFFALQVSQSAAVTAAIKSVHNSLVQHSEALQAALVEPELAHLTLMVTALDTEKDVQRAEAAMGSFADQLALDDAWLEPMALSLEGLSHFRHQVLYLEISRDAQHARLLAFAQALRDHMQASGVESTDDREFTGHVTVAKLSKIRPKRRKSGAKLKRIAEEGYAEHLSMKAGQVLVTELQLCRMQGRESGAYYQIQKSVQIHHKPDNLEQNTIQDD